MLDFLRELGIDPALFLATLAISAILLFFAYRPFIISIFDPLVVFMVSMCANCVLMFGLGWDTDAKIEFGLFVFFFWVGFALCGRIPRSHPALSFDPRGLFELEIVLFLIFILVVAANLYLGMTVGFPLLSSDPSVTKVTSFTGGLGVVRRLNEGPFLFLASGCLFLLISGHRRYFALTVLVISSGFVALSGSKGALLPLLFMQAFLVHHKGFGSRTRLVKTVRKMAIPVFAAAVGTALAVVVKDLGSLQAGMLFLGKRILFYGDIILYYYPRRGAIPELMGAGMIDYIKYLLNPLLGMFRLVEYSAPLGTTIAGTADMGFGPNAQFFVRADIFFGPVVGCGYCLANGAFIGFLRRTFFKFQTQNAIVFTFMLTLAVDAFTVATESQMFVTDVIDTALLLVPLWAVAHLIRVAAFDQAALSESKS